MTAHIRVAAGGRLSVANSPRARDGGIETFESRQLQKHPIVRNLASLWLHEDRSILITVRAFFVNSSVLHSPDFKGNPQLPRKQEPSSDGHRNNLGSSDTSSEAIREQSIHVTQNRQFT